MTDPTERRPIPSCAPYVIDRRGCVFNAKTSKRPKTVTATEAAAL